MVLLAEVSAKWINFHYLSLTSFDFCKSLIAACSQDIGGFRNSQSDVIFAHAHIRGRQRFVQLYGICVKCGFIFWENGLL